MRPIRFRENMDPHSLDLYIDEKNIGFLQWHTGDFKIIIWSDPGTTIKVDEIEYILGEMKRIKEQWNYRTTPSPEYVWGHNPHRTVSFRMTMDAQAYDFLLDGRNIGFLRWHQGPFEIVIWEDPGLSLWKNELEKIVEKVREMREHLYG